MSEWPIVPLSEILTAREETPDPDAIESGDIRIVNKIGFNDGKIELRTGSSTQTSMILIRPGDLVISGINAMKGAVAIHESDENKPIAATIHYSAYYPNPNKVIVRYLWYLLRTRSFRNTLANQFPGGIKTELKPRRLLPVKIPLPPLGEQRRIAARLDAIADRLEQAQRLRDETASKFERLLIQMAHRDDLSREQKLARGWKEIDLNEVIRQTKDRHLVTPEESYPNLGIYSFGRGLFKKPPIDGAETSARELYRVKTGQFIYSRLFAFEGACGVVTDEYDGCYVSGEFPTFECDPQQVKPEFLFTYFKSPKVWRTLLSGSKGLGNRRQRIQPKILLAHRLLLPPMEVQEQLVAMFRKAEAFIGISSETQQKLSVFIPAVLERAFNGEL